MQLLLLYSGIEVKLLRAFEKHVYSSDVNKFLFVKIIHIFNLILNNWK